MESAREHGHGTRSGFLIRASYASEAAPLLKACSERDARTACIFSATRRYRRWLPLESRNGGRGATCGEKCESAANAAGTRSARPGSQFWPGKRVETPDFHERSTRCQQVASVVPPWFTPSTLFLLLPPCPRLPSFIHPPAFHLPFAGLAHSFARSRVPASH